MSAEAGLTITENAAKRISEIIAQEGEDGNMLRVSVYAGGCSGFSYSFDLDGATNDDDRIYEGHGIKVVVDEMSLGLIDGSEVDFVDDLIGASFRLNNPQASSACGCGVSFSV